MKQIYIYLFNGFSDWEISYLTPEINKSDEFELIYFSKDGKSVTSMGGLQIIPKKSLKELKIDEVDMLVLPGGEIWEKEKDIEIEKLCLELYKNNTSIAGICGATIFLGQLGLLNKINHTSNDLNYLKALAPKYLGNENYQNTFAETDKNIITANGIAPIEFAKEIFRKIELKSEEDIEKWFQLFKNGLWSE